MSEHPNQQRLIGYIHQTLSDDEREVLDRHLATCQACRSRLADHDRLQHRIRYGLMADLRAIQPPGTLTFDVIASRLEQRRSLRFRQLTMRMTVAVAAAALLITLVVLANQFQLPAANAIGPALAANQAADFAALRVNPGADGWFLAGSAPQNYESGIDQAVMHDGKSSGYISSTVHSSDGFGTLMQMFKADDYRGQRLRLSAYIKAEHVDGWAGLWMRVDGPANEMAGFDNTQNKPIRGTVDWQPVAIVLDVPQNGVGIAFGVLLQGTGRIWIDHVQFEVVGQNVSTTNNRAEAIPPMPQPINLGFEAGLRGWSPESASQDYTIDIDPTVAHSGQASGHIQSKVAEPLGAGTLSQYVKADDYQGKQLRIIGYFRFDNINATAHFIVYAFGPHDTLLRSDSQPISSTAVWQRHDIILNVPDNSAQIAYGIVLEGKGQVWIDDVQIEVVGSQVLSAPLDRTIEQQPANLDFEAGNTGWSAAGSDTQEYVSGIDPTIAYRGQASGSIQSIVSRPGGLGLLRQTVKAGEYRDKRVRVSGYLRVDRLDGGASFLLTISGQQDQMIYANSRSIDGPTDWQWFWLVLNVPVNSDRIEYGLALRGEGQVWIDDVRVELVGNDMEISSFETSPIQPAFIGPSQPGNLDFESDADLQAWFNSRNPDYEVNSDHRVVHSGSASAHIQSKATVSAGSYEVLSQFIRTDSYRGQRLRLSGYIKTNQVEGWAGMWMNIADSGNQLLVLDNMQNRPITGTIDWREYEIVLDIPENGAVIGFGALLQGKGEIWWDDVKLEVVGPDVSTTHPYQQQPLNLDFENSK